MNATLTFHQRVKMFVKHIIMSSGNPMCIKYNSYKVEFALRGAGHIHGVLWMDWENFSFPQAPYANKEKDMKENNDETEKGTKEKDEKYKKDNLIKAFEKIRNEVALNVEEKESITKFVTSL